MTNAPPASNPLLHALGPHSDVAELVRRLAHKPLSGIDRRDLSAEEREALLETIRDVFAPTASAIVGASRLQRMIRHGYTRRDPTIASNRRELHRRLAMRTETPGIQSRWHSSFADGMMIKGLTGLGKSHLIQRFCSLVEQVHVHGPCAAAEWERQTQINYLIVPMAENRGGLLMGVLEALDRALLNTTYLGDYNRKRLTIERLAVQVGALLATYHVGILIIEELQLVNFAEAPAKKQMLQTFLRLLNFGIPIVLVGNPLAFDWLGEHSQDTRRLTTREPIELSPMDESGDEWRKGFAPALWAHSVMPVGTPFSDDISKELWLCSGGFPGFAWPAVRDVQQLALDMGQDSVSAKDLRQYRATSESYRANRNLIEGFVRKDARRLSGYLDVPWEYYARQWAPPGGDASDVASKSEPAGTPKVESPQPEHKALRRKEKAQRTAEARRREADEVLRMTLEPSDLRAGNTDSLIAGLKKLQENGGGV